MIAQNIQANLTILGLTDMMVTGMMSGNQSLDQAGGTIPVTDAPMLLSTLCAESHTLRHSAEMKHRQAGGNQFQLNSYNIQVVNDAGDTIGKIDSDGVFQYTAAPDLALCLGWAIATDIGRNKVIEDVSLQNLTSSTQDRITGAVSNAMSQDYFFGDWMNFLEKDLMVYDRTTRFGDGYCGVANLFWEVGLRTLFGIEHSGYDFAY